MDATTPKLSQFLFDGSLLTVTYSETLLVKEGVECDSYAFANDTTKDLAIVRVAAGYKTPLQRIMVGTQTLEGFVSGSGVLTTVSTEGVPKIHRFADGDSGVIAVTIGERMQWEAGPNGLTFSEVCEPPYQDGRFENLPDDPLLLITP